MAPVQEQLGSLQPGSARRVGLRRQWRSAVAVLIAVLAVALGATVISLVQVVGRYRSSAQTLNSALSLTSDIAVATARNQRMAHDVLDGAVVDPVAFDRGRKILDSLLSRGLVELRGPGEHELMTEAADSWRRLVGALGVSGVPAPHRSAFTETTRAKFDADAQRVEDRISRLAGVVLTNASRDLGRADALQNGVAGLLAVLFTLVVGIVTQFAMRMTTGVVEPIESLVAEASRLRRGEPGYRIAIPPRYRRNEVGELAEAFNSMADALGDVQRDGSGRATYDSLTGLASRATFQKRLDSYLAPGAARDPDGLTVLFVDIEDFASVNDTLGHAMGDALLVVVAGRLLSCVRSDDLVARLAGDDFAVLVSTRDSAARIADRVMRAFTVPCEFSGHTVPVTVRIGISSVSRSVTDAERLLAEADFAVFTAKRTVRRGSAGSDREAGSTDETVIRG